MRSVEEYLGAHRVDPHELAYILMHHFRLSSSDGPLVRRFQTEGKEHALTVRSQVDDRIVSILVSDDFPDSELASLRDTVAATLLGPRVDAIGQEVLFSWQRRVKGGFRYKDEFQILPVPTNAPQTDTLWAAFPFLLQFKYADCSDMMVERMRRRERVTRHARLLNLLTHSTISMAPTINVNGWALCDPQSAVPSAWVPLEYQYTGQRAVIAAYVDATDVATLQRIPKSGYYTDVFGEPAHELALPDNFEASLECAASLSDENQRKLDRALAWISQSGQIWQSSVSAAYVALASSLETLLEEMDVEHCKLCRQPRYAVNARFKKFLRNYLPQLDQYPKARDRFYGVRSKIAHGIDMFQQDLEPWKTWPGPLADDEAKLYQGLSRLVKIAVYNWMWSPT